MAQTAVEVKTTEQKINEGEYDRLLAEYRVQMTAARAALEAYRAALNKGLVRPQTRES
jgi:hypothetical protein